jgi:hypothetical protein
MDGNPCTFSKDDFNKNQPKPIFSKFLSLTHFSIFQIIWMIKHSPTLSQLFASSVLECTSPLPKMKVNFGTTNNKCKRFCLHDVLDACFTEIGNNKLN